MAKATREDLIKKGVYIDEIENLKEESKAVFEPPVRLTNTILYNTGVIGAYTNLRGGIIRNVKSIGRFCMFAPGFSIGMGEHPTDWLSIHEFQYADKFGFDSWNEASNFNTTIPKVKTKLDPVIGNDVWLGSNVTILKGVTIGDGAIIAAGAVVNKDVKPYEIVGGIPAKHIKFRFNEEIRDKLLELKWWNYTLDSLEGLQFDDIEVAVAQLEERKEKGLLVERKNPRVKLLNREFVKRISPEVEMVDETKTLVQSEKE